MSLVIITLIISIISGLAAITLSVLNILDKMHSVKEKYSKEAKVKMTISKQIFGSSIRTEKEKKDFESFEYFKFPKIVPHIAFEVTLINYEKSDNVVTLDIYFETKEGERINVYYMSDILLKPMEPKTIKDNRARFNVTNEIKFWGKKDFSEKDTEKAHDLIWKRMPRYFCIAVEDAYGKTKLTKMRISN